MAITLAALMSAKYLPVAVAGVLSAGCRQVGPIEANSTSPPASPLLAWVLKGWPSTRLALALDATSLGGDRRRCYRGGIPVAWKVLPGNVARLEDRRIALLREFAGLVPPGLLAVPVMTDRGTPAGSTGRSSRWAGTR